MAEIIVYSKSTCPYCREAMTLLREKGKPFTVIDLYQQPQARAEMIAKAGGRSTVPQIFIDGKHIGGCDDLYDLDGRGGLDPLLAS